MADVDHAGVGPRHRTRDLALFNPDSNLLLDFRDHTAACARHVEELLFLNEPDGPGLDHTAVEWVDELPRHPDCSTVWRAAPKDRGGDAR